MRVVFIHGAFSRDGAWWWAPVAALLDRRGLASTSVALPSCGEAGVPPTGAGPGLQDDVAATTAVLDEGGPAILVAHSYGGMVASEAGAHPAVRGLVYISSFLPAAGQSLAGLSSGSDPLPVTPHPDGSLSANADDRVTFDARFLHDVGDPEVVQGAHDRLCAQSPAAFGDATTTAAWERVPSLYLVCAEDRSTDPELQRAHAARAGATRELAAAHFPMLSRPELVADAVDEFVVGLEQGRLSPTPRARPASR